MEVVEDPVRARCVVLKCEHGEVGVGTMVQAGQATSGIHPKVYSEQILPILEHGAPIS